MTDTIVSSREGLPKWLLLAQLTLERRSSSNQYLADWLLNALQTLRLKPVQLERIKTVIVQALNRAGHSLQQADNENSVDIRIWSSQASRDESGWGYFVVEKREIKPQATKGENTYVVDLYLYQE